MAESLDYIDENENIIGTASFHDVHEKGLLHKYVHGLLLDDANRIALQLRGPGNRTDPYTFDATVGGHVDAGEDYQTSLLREAEEEIGLTLTPHDITLVGRIESRSLPVENMVGRLYILRHPGPMKLDPDEVLRIEWMSIEECAALLQRFPYLFCRNFISSFQLLQEWLKR